jgi:hypothetical protein
MIVTGGTYWKYPGDDQMRGESYILVFPSMETAKIAIDLIRKTQKQIDVFDTREERTKIYEKAIETFKEKVGSDVSGVYDSAIKFLKRVCIGDAAPYEYCGGATIGIMKPDEDGVFFV